MLFTLHPELVTWHDPVPGSPTIGELSSMIINVSMGQLTTQIVAWSIQLPSFGLIALSNVNLALVKSLANSLATRFKLLKISLHALGLVSSKSGVQERQLFAAPPLQV